MIDSIAKKTLDLWGINEASLTLIANRENTVFRIQKKNGESLALRIHRADYVAENELASELLWMDELVRVGLSVPRPMASINGLFFESVQGRYVDVLSWLSGDPLGSSSMPLAIANAQQVFFSMGEKMARLHHAADHWRVPDLFVRREWNLEGYLGDRPLWGKFWQHPGLNNEQQRLFKTVRDVARQTMLSDAVSTLDYGLIHADLVRENILLSGDQLSFIDFDDSGYGYRLFDIATALYKNRHEADYVSLKEHMIRGYQSVRAIDLNYLSLFTLLRSMSYVGWIMSRQDIDAGGKRSKRYIDDAVLVAKDYLANPCFK